jgi:hypothetical protein
MRYVKIAEQYTVEAVEKLEKYCVAKMHLNSRPPAPKEGG